jgi:hypothetical protein
LFLLLLLETFLLLLVFVVFLRACTMSWVTAAHYDRGDEKVEYKENAHPQRDRQVNFEEAAI